MPSSSRPSSGLRTLKMKALKSLDTSANTHPTTEYIQNAYNDQQLPNTILELELTSPPSVGRIIVSKRNKELATLAVNVSINSTAT